MRCYSSEAEKRSVWPVETAPAILACASRAVNVLHERQAIVAWLRKNGIHTAADLHDACRRGRYMEPPKGVRHCDPIQPVPMTMAHGGDCDQWAAVVMAGLRVLGLADIWLVAVGDPADPYRHAFTVCRSADRYWILDPKPDQEGVEFNVRADSYPLKQFFRFTA
jgi:hypothetical protein